MHGQTKRAVLTVWTLKYQSMHVDKRSVEAPRRVVLLRSVAPSRSVVPSRKVVQSQSVSQSVSLSRSASLSRSSVNVGKPRRRREMSFSLRLQFAKCALAFNSLSRQNLSWKAFRFRTTFVARRGGPERGRALGRALAKTRSGKCISPVVCRSRSTLNPSFHSVFAI